MNREEVLKSPEYWTAKTQVELYNQAESFMKETGRNKTVGRVSRSFQRICLPTIEWRL